jgi:hypothetical protein
LPKQTPDLAAEADAARNRLALPNRRENGGDKGESGTDRENFNFDGGRHDRVLQEFRMNARRIDTLTIRTLVSSLWQR